MFRRDYKHEGKDQHKLTLDADFVTIVAAIAETGHWTSGNVTTFSPGVGGFPRLPHQARPGPYSKPNAETLKLVQLGSHAELGL
jgi:mRNA interferase YafQ